MFDIRKLSNKFIICVLVGNPSSPTPPQEFCKKTFHLSGYGVTGCNIIYYGMKDEESILQFSFKAENDEKFSAKRFFNLSRMIFRLEQKTFFLSARRPDTLLAWVENVPENGVAMRFRGSFLLYLGRFIGLKRIGRLSCESCFMLTFPLLYLRIPCPFVVFCERQKSWTVDRLFILQLARIAYFLVLPV